MSVFRISLSTSNVVGHPISMASEAAFASVEEFVEAASNSYLIAGDRLTYTDDGRGGRLITNRERTAVGVPSIATLMIDRFRYWEPTE